MEAEVVEVVTEVAEAEAVSVVVEAEVDREAVGDKLSWI